MKVPAILDFLPASVTLMAQTHHVGFVMGLGLGLGLGFILVRLARWCSTPIIIVRGPARADVGGEGIASAEDRKRLDGLREIAIRRRLNEFTVSLNESDALPSQSDEKQPSSTTLFLPTDNDKNISANGGEEATCGTEEETTSDEADETEEGSSQTLPLLARDLDGRPTAATAPQKYRATKNGMEGNDWEAPVVVDECPICHEEYGVGDRVCRSSDPECRHVFHERCIVDWLVALGRMRSKRKSARRRFSKSGAGRAEERELLDYDLECPCCRRDFVARPSLIGGASGEEEV